MMMYRLSTRFVGQCIRLGYEFVPYSQVLEKKMKGTRQMLSQVKSSPVQ